jgi:hypothetical protein
MYITLENNHPKKLFLPKKHEAKEEFEISHNEA